MHTLVLDICKRIECDAAHHRVKGVYAKVKQATDKQQLEMGVCGTYGCTRPDKHRGLHDIPFVPSRRRSRQYECDHDKHKRATIPKFNYGRCVDTRDEILVTDPMAHYRSGGTTGIPPSPHPMTETVETIQVIQTSPSSPTTTVTTSDLGSTATSSGDSRFDLVEHGTVLGSTLWCLLERCNPRAPTPPCVLW